MKHHQFRLQGFTDYPFACLGDKDGVIAPMRPIEIISYDRNKYADIIVAGFNEGIKLGYCYSDTKKGKFDYRSIEALPMTESLSIHSLSKDEMRCENWHPVFRANITVEGLASADMIEWLNAFETNGGHSTWTNHKLWFERMDDALEFYMRFK